MALGGNNVIGEAVVEVGVDNEPLRTGLRDSREELNKYHREMQSKSDQAVASWRRMLHEATRGLTDQTEKTKAADKALADWGKEFERAERNAQRLAAALDPLTAATLRFKKAQEQTQAAHALGVLTDSQATTLIEQAGARYGTEIGKLALQGNADAIAAARELGVELDGLGDAATSAGMAAKGGALGFAAVGAAMAAAAVAAKQMVDASIEIARGIENQSRQLGISTDEWQTWSYIAQQASVQQSDLSQGFENLQRVLSRAAAGDSNAQSALAQLGIDADNAHDAMLQLAQVLPNIADENQRMAAATYMLGESANELIPVLEDAATGYERLSQEMAAMGMSLSPEEIERLTEAGQKMDMLNRALSMRIAGVVAENADAIMDLTDKLLQLADVAFKALDALMTLANSDWGQRFTDAAMAAMPGVHVLNALAGMSDIGNNPEFGGGGAAEARAREIMAGEQGARIRAVRSPALTFTTPRSAGRGRSSSNRNREAGQRRFERQLEQLEMSILRAQQGLADTAEERHRLAMQMLELSRTSFRRQLELEVSQGRMLQSEADQLNAKNDELYAARQRAALIDAHVELEQRNFDITQTELTNRQRTAQNARQLATSRAEAVAIERELLDLQYELERLALNRVISNENLDKNERELAQTTLNMLELWKAQEVEMLRLASMNPIERFYYNLQIANENIKEIAQEFQAGKLRQRVNDSQRMADDMADAMTNVVGDLLALEGPIQTLRNLLLNLANIFNEEVILRPIREWVRMNVAGPIAERVTGAGSGPEGVAMSALKAAMNDQTASTIAASTATKAFAADVAMAAIALRSLSMSTTAGGVMGGSSSIIGGISDALKGAKFHDGGLIGGSGERMILAQSGEYVMPRSAVRMFRPQLEAMRSGVMPSMGRGASIRFGDINVSGPMSRAEARRTGKQIAAEIHREVSRTVKSGMVGND